MVGLCSSQLVTRSYLLLRGSVSYRRRSGSRVHHVAGLVQREQSRFQFYHPVDRDKSGRFQGGRDHGDFRRRFAGNLHNWLRVMPF